MMRSGFRLLALALALVATLVAAESELAHAMEVIYMYSKYQTEGQVYTKDYWVAAGCQNGLNRRCTFNEFVSFLKSGDRTRGPQIIELNGAFNWRDPAQVQTVATKMANLKDARGTLYMAGDIPASRVMSGVNGITGLFNKFQQFDRDIMVDINKMTDQDKKNTAKASLDNSNKVLEAAYNLRRATRQQKLHDELIKKFSPTGKLDKIYEYQKDGKTLRFDPIQWVVEKKSLWGREFQSINVPESAKKNPQMNDPILEQRIKAHINLFNSDGEDGRGKGLINYDPRYAGTNARHQHVIDMQNRVGKAYGQNCK